MPYARNSELPKSVREALPDKAQTIFRKAFNSADSRGLSESSSFKVAWGAVKNAGYRKNKEGRWVKVKKSVEDFTVMLVSKVLNTFATDSRSDFDTTPWNGDPSQWPDAESYCSDCLIDVNPQGEKKIKNLCKLPYRKPNAKKPNIHALRAMGSGARGIGALKKPSGVPDAKWRSEVASAKAWIRKQWKKAFDTEPPASVRKAVSMDISIIKSNMPRGLVYGEVLIPDEVDAQGDFATAEAIEEAAHRYMEFSRGVDYRHQDRVTEDAAVVVESYVAPVDFIWNGRDIKAGTWLVAIRVKDDEIKKEIISGELNAFSIMGSAKREEVND